MSTMKMHTIKPGAAPATAPIIEKSVAPEQLEDLNSIYGMENMDADMQRKLRILRKADPELYRKIANLD